MDHTSTPDPDASLAAQAFGELRAEVSLLRRAVERLTDERTAQPDYGPTLEAIDKRFQDVCGWAKRVSEQPALTLTPETRCCVTSVDSSTRTRSPSSAK